MSDGPRFCPKCGLHLGPLDTICLRCGADPNEKAAPDASSSEPALVRTVQCPHCGAVSPAEIQICSGCGSDLPSPRFSASAVWPPTPQGAYIPESPFVQLVTKSIAGDIIAGVATTMIGLLASIFTFGISLIAMLIMYFTFRRKYKVYGRGMNYGFAAVFFILMAPCLFCLAGIQYPSLHRLIPWLPSL